MPSFGHSIKEPLVYNKRRAKTILKLKYDKNTLRNRKL
jgi:hypothetical protein